MTATHRNLRLKMLLTTASAALLAIPTSAHAQLVSGGDLVTAQDSAGNPGQLTISNPDANTANISVLAPVVVADWTRFNVPLNTTLNVSNASAAAQASLMNRVIGGTASDIGGTINALGVNLWLVNQNGILFGSNTQVSAASFFASTLDVSNQDFFDYYEGTDIAGNGTNNIRFSTSPASTTGIFGPAGASFVTDGTIFFGSSALNLDATFDASSGGVGFVAANDFTVTFDAGSPVGYAVAAGTTVANQRVAGSVSGQRADFVMVSAAGVVGALLQVDANVATTAAPTATGIFLGALGVSAPEPDVVVNGTLTSSGQVATTIGGDLTANAAITGSSVFLNPIGDLTTQAVSATAGDAQLSGATVTTGALSATRDVSVDSAGTVSLASATADSDNAGGGSLLVGSVVTPTSLTITGASRGASVDMQASGDLQLGSVTSTAGVVELDSTGGAISAGAVSATGGDASLTAPGAITTTSIASTGAIDVDSTAGGNLNLGNLNAGTTIALDTSGSLALGSANAGGAFTIGAAADPSSVTITGNVVAGSIDFDTTGLLSAQDITATAGTVRFDVGSIATSDVSATGDLTFSVSNTGNAAFDSLMSTGGAVRVNGFIPSNLTVTGETRGTVVSLVAINALTLGNVTSTSGNATLQSINGALGAGAVSATGGNARLVAAGNVTASSVGSTTGGVDVDSTGGGNLNLGNLNAGTTIALDTSGTITAAAATAAGAFTIGAVVDPSSVTFTGNVTGASIDFDVTGAFAGQGISATAGDIDIDAGSVTAAALTATDDIFVDAAGAVSLASALADSDANGAGSLIVGATTAPATLTIAGTAQGAAVDLQSAGNVSLADVTATNGPVDLDSTGGAISAGAVTALGGNAELTAAGTVTTARISATDNIDVDGGGPLSLGTLNATNNITLDTPASVATQRVLAGGAFTVGGSIIPSTVFFGDAVTAGSVDILTSGALNAHDITATTSTVRLSADSITAEDVLGESDVTFQTSNTNDATFASLISNNGVVAVAGTIPRNITVTGLTKGQTVILAAVQNLNLGTVISTSGDVLLLAINGSAQTGDIASASSATVNAFGNVSTGSIFAVNAISARSGAGGALTLGNLYSGTTTTLDTTGTIFAGSASAGGALTVGGAFTPSSVTFVGDIDAASVDINTVGLLNAQNIRANAGDIDIDAGSVLARVLLASDDIFVDAAGDVSLSSAYADRDGDGVGNLAIGAATAPASLAISGQSQGVAVDLNAVGNLALGAVTSTGGDVTIDGGSISAGNIVAGTTAVPGSALLTATGDITTGAITATAAIDVDSTAGGNLQLGNLSAASTIALDTTGSLSAGAATAGGALTVGAAAVPSSANFGGDIRAAGVDIDVAGALLTQGIASTAGVIDIDAGSIGAGTVSATGGDALLTASGNITTGSIDSTGTIDVDSTAGGNVRLGNLSAGSTIALDTTGSLSAGSASAGGSFTVGGLALPSAATFGGAIDAASIDIDVTGALVARDMTARAGAIDIDAGSVTAAGLTASGAVAVDASGSVVLGSVAANSDGVGVDGVAIGAVTLPSSLQITGATSGSFVDLQASGNVTLGSVTSTAGVVDIDSTAGSIATGAITGQGVGGDVLLTAAQNVTATGDIASMLGRVDIDAVAGAISVAGVFAGGGATELTALTTITATGGITGRNVDIDAGGALDAQAITATAGDVDIDAGSVKAGVLTATDDVFVDSAGAILIASARADSDASGAGNLAIGALTLPSSLTVTGASQGVAVDMQASGNVALGAVTSTGGVVDIDSTGGSISTAAVTAQGGDALLTAAQSVSASGIITASGAVDIAAVSGSISTLAVTANGGDAALTAGNAVTAAGTVMGRNVDIDAGGALNAQAITATAGDIDIDARSVNAGALSATDDVFVDASGSVRLASARADSDASGAGNLQVGLATAPSSLTVTGASRGRLVDLRASGDVNLGTVASDNGITNVLSTAGSITTAGVAATGGDAVLRAAQNVTASAAISATGKVDIDAVGGSISTAAVTASGGNAELTAGQNVIATGLVSAAGKVDIDAANGFISTAAITATGGNAELTARGDVTASGTVTGRTVDIDSLAGSISTAALTATAGDALLTAAQSVTASGTVSATGKVDIDATNGAISTAAVTASGGNAELTARGNVTSSGTVTGRTVDIDSTTGSIATAAITATAGDALLTAAQNVTATGAVGATGKVDIDAVGGSISTAAVTASGGNAELTAGRDVTASGTVAASAKVDIDAIVGSISAAAITATAGNAELTAGSGVTTTGTVRAGGAIDVDSTGSGNLALGTGLTTAATPALSANGAVSLDTLGSVTAGATTAGGAFTIGTAAIPSSVTLTGVVSAASMTARTAGVFTSQAAINAGSAATITARDMAIGAALGATNVTLRAGSGGTVALGTGTGTLSLSDTELDRITATNLTIDAGANPVTVADVSFTGAAGSARVDVATSATIAFAGDLSGDGANRVFRFGGGAGTGDATATGLATRITGDIEAATINLGQASLDLRATDIAFGRTAFIGEVAGRSSGDLAATVVGNAASSLYNSELNGALGGDRTSDRTYLKAGSLKVSYANSALFQNTGTTASGASTSSGVALGAMGSTGVLTLDTTDQTNAFALFGTINNLAGSAAALAGPSVIVVDGTLQPPNSRVNGCIIGSGAGCLNTTIGTTAITLPRENVNLLSADNNLLVPFDPLVGTNNEGLFSDAASDEESLDCPKDENGICVDREGAQ